MARMFKVILPICLVGCGQQTTDTDLVYDLDPRVEVGIGYPEFVSLTGDTLVLVHGPAGTHHFEFAAVVRNMPEMVGVATSVRRLSTDALLTEEASQVSYVMLEPYLESLASGYLLGIRTPLDHEYLADKAYCDLVGESVEICLTVEDPDSEVTVDGCAVVRVALDSMDEEDCASFPRER